MADRAAGPRPEGMAVPGLCLIGSGAGCGKTWHTVGLLRALTERGHTCVPFKPVAVVDLDDLTSHDSLPAARAIHHHLVAAGIPYAPEYNPLTVVPEQAGGGTLYGGGERLGQVALAGPDQVDFATMPEPLYRRCVALVEESLVECQRMASVVLVEGAGDGTRGACDVANVVAPMASGYPVVAIYRPARARHSTLAAFWYGLPEPVRGRVCGVLVNNPEGIPLPIQPIPGGVEAVVVGGCDLPEITGTLVRQRERNQLLAEHVWRSVPWESWLSQWTGQSDDSAAGRNPTGRDAAGVSQRSGRGFR